MTTTTRTDRRPARRHREIAALVAACGGLLLAAVGISSAAYTDLANLNLGADGVGLAGRFDLAVVLPDGSVEQADVPDGYDWDVPDAASLVPGHEVTTVIPVFNNTELLRADTTFELVLRGDGAVGDGIPNIAPLLRFTATDAAGQTLFSDVPWDQAAGSLGVLAARGSDSLAEGDAYEPGAPGSETSVTLTIAYPDAPGVEDYNGGQAAVSVRFHATSVAP